MKTVRDLLRDADPLRYETQPPARERGRVRQRIVVAASDNQTTSARSLRPGITLLITATLIIISLVAIGWRTWSRGGATLEAAAVRFEVRLAEVAPAAGLQEARVSKSETAVYLHREIVVTNSDIAKSNLLPADARSHFGIGVQFNAAGAQRMRRATANHVGRPMAILIDGDVIAAPVIRTPISASAAITGDYTKAEAERIANGIGIR